MQDNKNKIDVDNKRTWDMNRQNLGSLIFGFGTWQYTPKKTRKREVIPQMDILINWPPSPKN